MPKISELPSVAAPLTTDTIPLVEAGVTSRATLASLPISTATQTELDRKTTNSAAAITGGSVTGITDLAVADGGTGASTAAGARTNLGAAASGANSDITSLSALTSINGGQLAGLRNKIINGNPLVNQRGAASASTAYADGAYFLDRWKAGAGGATLSFATSNNVVTITITAGSIIQVVEGLNLASGTHTLSWSGTAQGKIGAGSYSSSGVTGSITGGTNTNVEFNTGTVSLVQLEPGSVATPFEHRPYGLELALCQRYYQSDSNPALNAEGNQTAASNGIAWCSYYYPVQMRTTPTLSLPTFSTNNCGAVSNTANQTPRGFSLANVAGGTGAGRFFWGYSSGTLTASAEL